MMNIRVKSAGVDRGRANEMASLQATVLQLQQQMNKCRDDYQYTKQQLQCLISLVRSAWSGDQSAVIHVANIVGTAPPELLNEEGRNKVLFLPKTRVLNNWAALTVGLLNRNYCEEEREQELRQKQFLHNREAYFAEQMTYDAEMSGKTFHRTDPYALEGRGSEPVFKTQPAPSPEPEAPAIKVDRFQSQPRPERVSSAKKKPTMGHLYRQPLSPEKSRVNGHPINGLYIDASQPSDKLHEGATMHFRTPSHHYACPGQDDGHEYSSNGCGDDPHYADPRRYARNGLFDESRVTSATSSRRRPPSGLQQRHADGVRARPKSAGYGILQGQRPLKYETTRPVSAHMNGLHHTATHGKPPTVLLQQRRGSGDLSTENRSRPPMGNRSGDATAYPDGDLEAGPTQRQPNVSIDSDCQVDDMETADMVATSAGKAAKKRPIMKVKIKTPESVNLCVQDMKRLELMEEDFKKTTFQLQKKLGIDVSGMI